jgi:hypothetical protein
VSARRPAVNRPPVGSRDEIQNLVTYHTKTRDAIENHHETEKMNLFSARNRTDAHAQFGRFTVNGLYKTIRPCGTCRGRPLFWAGICSFSPEPYSLTTKCPVR